MKVKKQLLILLENIRNENKVENYENFINFLYNNLHEDIINTCSNYFNNEGNFEDIKNFYTYLNIESKNGSVLRQLCIGSAIWSRLNSKLSEELSIYFKIIKELKK